MLTNKASFSEIFSRQKLIPRGECFREPQGEVLSCKNVLRWVHSPFGTVDFWKQQLVQRLQLWSKFCLQVNNTWFLKGSLLKHWEKGVWTMILKEPFRLKLLIKNQTLFQWASGWNQNRTPVCRICVVYASYLLGHPIILFWDYLFQWMVHGSSI